MYKQYRLLLLVTVLTMHNYAQSLTTELVNLTKHLKQLGNSLQEPNQSLETLLENSSYVDKKIEIHGYPIYFLKVLRQGPYDCQLHSLKNALYGINLLEHAPHALEKNIALLTSKELYEKLLSEWTKITLTCNHVSDKAIENIMEAIKNKTTPPKELYKIPKNISFFNNLYRFPINFKITDLFETNKPHRIAILNEHAYLHAFLLSFIFQNKKEIDFTGTAIEMFQHAIALIVYKSEDKTLFLVADSWYGGNEYTKQRDAYVADAVRTLTMQDENFYEWYGGYFLQKAKLYADKGNSNRLAGFWINALVAFKKSLNLYKKITVPLAEQQKKAICDLTRIFMDNKKLYNEIIDLDNKWWNDDIKTIEQSIKDLKVEC